MKAPWKVVLGGFVILAAVSARAQDSPDVLDMSVAFDNGVDPAMGIKASITSLSVYGSYAYVGGQFSVDPDSGGPQYGDIYWYMYEPYKVQRAALGGKLSQKNHVCVYVYGSDGTTSYSSSCGANGTDGCAASFAGKDVGDPPNGIYGSGDYAKWSVKCKYGLNQMFGLDTAQRATFASLFGTEKINFTVDATIP